MQSPAALVLHLLNILVPENRSTTSLFFFIPLLFVVFLTPLNLPGNKPDCVSAWPLSQTVNAWSTHNPEVNEWHLQRGPDQIQHYWNVFKHFAISTLPNNTTKLPFVWNLSCEAAFNGFSCKKKECQGFSLIPISTGTGSDLIQKAPPINNTLFKTHHTCLLCVSVGQFRTACLSWIK